MITEKDIGRFVYRRDFPNAVGKIAAVEKAEKKCYVHFFSDGKKFLLSALSRDLELIVDEEKIKKLEAEFQASKKRSA
jgi:hypothetical protein